MGRESEASAVRNSGLFKTRARRAIRAPCSEVGPRAEDGVVADGLELVAAPAAPHPVAVPRAVGHALVRPVLEHHELLEALPRAPEGEALERVALEEGVPEVEDEQPRGLGVEPGPGQVELVPNDGQGEAYVLWGAADERPASRGRRRVVNNRRQGMRARPAPGAIRTRETI